MSRSPRRLSWIALAAVLLVVLPVSALAQSKPYGGKILQTFNNCGLTQIFGTVKDAAGNPKNGVGVRLWWADAEVRTTSGSKPDVGAAGWDFSLNTQPVANTWYVAVEDASGTLLSDPVAVTTSSACNAGSVNVVQMEFREGGATSPAPNPQPQPPVPGNPPGGGEAAPPIAAGATCRWYTETGGGRGGFSVCDDVNARFLTTFNQYGLQRVGYPISQRYKRDGFITQAFQKAILQWRPDGNYVAFVNVFDDLHRAGYDQTLLERRQTPFQLDPNFDAGLSFEQAVAKRQALLNVRPALRSAYFSVSDPLLFYGLPTSEVKDMGNHYAVRMQRGVLQEWKENVPWARAGQVTVANGADIAKELGGLPAFSLTPEASPPGGGSVPAPQPQPPAPTAPANPTPSPTPVPTQPPASNELPRNLDPRLPALGVGIQGVNVPVGARYWRVTEIIWHDVDQAGGRHALLMDALSENGSRVVGQTITVQWAEGSSTVLVEPKPFPEYGANFPMYKAGQSYTASVDGLPSETVTGLGLGTLGPTRAWRTDHVEYLITWQLTTKR